MANDNVKGAIITDFGGYDKGQTVQVQSDGKIVVLGTSDDNLAVARYNSDGSLDATFDTDGKLTATAVMNIHAMRQLNGGKFLTVGGSNGDFAVARYNSDGSLDSTFDGDGKLTTDFGYIAEVAYNLAVQADGKLLVAGYDSNYYGVFAAVRYNSNGSLDSSFSGTGRYSRGDSHSYIDNGVATCVAVQPDGKTVLAGNDLNHNDGDFYVIRLDNYGMPDPSFGKLGIVSTNLGGIDKVATVNILNTGKTLVAGVSNDNFALVRYNFNGSLDSSFGGDGMVITDLGGIDILNSAVTLANGKFLVAGTSNYDFVLARYNADGSLDKTFDKDGIVSTDLGGWEEANSLSLQADGKILLAGRSEMNGNSDFALVRYNSDGSLDTTFNGTDDTIPPTDDAIGSALNGVTGAFGYFGESQMSTYGQTFKTPNTTATLLNSFTLWVHPNFGTTQFQGYLAEWTGDKTGTILWHSNNYALTPNNLDQKTVFDGINQTLDANKTYVFFITTANLLDGVNDIASLAGTYNFTEQYQDGHIVYMTKGDFGQLTTASWDGANSYPIDDFEFLANFSKTTDKPLPNSAGFIITGSDFQTDENGDTAEFSVALKSAPNRDVAVSFVSTDSTEAIVSHGGLTFTSANWATPQTVSVLGQDDAELDGTIAYQVSASVATQDVNYTDLTIAPFTLTNLDNEAQPDTLYGTEGKDVLKGGSGDSTLYGLGEKDDLSGGTGNDELWGGYDNDVLYGESGNDKLYGEQNNDYLNGGEGNDTLDGGLNTDTLVGGNGADTYYLSYDEIDVVNDGGTDKAVDVLIMPYQLNTYTAT